MKAARISDIKKELKTCHPDLLIEYLLRISKYKVENKELISYLLFYSHNRDEYIKSIKSDLDEQFNNLNRSSTYLAKKTVRKALRTAQKHIKFAADKTIEIEVLIYFCLKLKTCGVALRYGLVLGNMYLRQTEKIQKVYNSLHEDLQLDYETELEKILK